jgi:PAS domain S-box-containing protein
MLDRIKKLFSVVPLGVVFFIPLMVLVGWFYNNSYLTRILPQFTPMNPVTAACFLAIGIFLLSITIPFSRNITNIILITTGAFLLVVGGVMSLKYVFGIDLYIDRIFFDSKLGINRMAPATAANFFLFGLGIFIKVYHAWIRRILLLIILSVGLYAAASYAYNFIGVYGKTLYNPMAIHTAVLFILCSLYVLIYEGKEGIFCAARWDFITRRFQNLKIYKKFSIGFGSVLVVILIFSLYAISAVHSIAVIYIEQEESTLAGQTALELEVDTLQTRVSFEEFVKTGNQSFIPQILVGRAASIQEENRLRILSILPETIQLLNEYEVLRIKRIFISDKIISLVTAHAKPETYAPLLTERNITISQANILLHKILQAQQSSLATLTDAGQTKIQIIQANLILLSLLVFLLILVLSFAIARSILYPVNLLKKQAEKIAKGDFATRNDLRTLDEMGVLGQTIDSMTKALGIQTAELQRAKAQDEAILSSIGDAVFAIDEHKKLILINPVAEAMAGVTKETSIGMAYNKSLLFEHEESGKENTTFIKTALSGKKTAMQNHTVLVTKNGKKIPVADSASPLIDDEGKVVGAVVVFRDVAKEREIEQAKNEFVSLASHQLRTPLTSIKWYSELLLDKDEGTLTESQKEYALEIQAAMVRMNDLVASLLDVSRLDLGTFVIEPIMADLTVIMKEAAHEQMPTFVQKKQHFIFDESKVIPPILIDPKLMRIIVQNLLSNAHKYSPEGSTITLSLEKEKNGSYVVRCADTGYGIPLVQQGSVFKKLFRADNIRTLDVEGTGLGLYIIKTIVDAAGCSITFTSEEGKGTTFNITIPKTGMRVKQGSKQRSGAVGYTEK